MIPRIITGQHILAAIATIRKEGFPDRRQSTEYCLVFEGAHFPPKYVVSLAHRAATGKDLPSLYFNGGTETNSYLESRDFETIPCRCGGRRRTMGGTTYSPSPPPPYAPLRTLKELPNSDRDRAVAQALLAYASESDDELVFTPNPEANNLIKTDPFAFLIAVICDQGIPAEAAWNVPHELCRRLGRLDPHWIATHPDAVAAAVKEPPALHRFVTTIAGWIVAAAERVVRLYGGDAGRIWSDTPTALHLQIRLAAFQGIGQKKAAMAVEILERDLGVPLRSMEGSDVAYDVHVRRVFLRTGLAQRDDPTEMIAAARRLHPARPGALDLPAWRIGRQWCHPGVPDCPHCPLNAVCPKHIDRAAAVRGA